MKVPKYHYMYTVLVKCSWTYELNSRHSHLALRTLLRLPALPGLGLIHRAKRVGRNSRL